MTLDELSALIASRAQESQGLEFKRAASLRRTDSGPSEIAKDVTAMANAVGGRIVYGITEVRTPEGLTVASAVNPIVDATITRERLTHNYAPRSPLKAVWLRRHHTAAL